MSAPGTASPLVLDPAVEAETRARLREHYAPMYGERVDWYVDSLLERGGYADRFAYLRSVLGPGAFRGDASILVSGFSAGSEMITAPEFGIGSIHGVEVDPYLLEVCRRRLDYLPGMYPCVYDGSRLPHPDGSFDLVASGHVIEHTRDPAHYLAECMRVLKVGGCLSLEFPDRYHHTELHTRLPSVEWLPRLLRNGALRVLSCRISPLAADVKRRYRIILDTNLQQIGVRDVRRMLGRLPAPCALLAVARPAPGFVRCVIRREGRAKPS